MVEEKVWMRTKCGTRRNWRKEIRWKTEARRNSREGRKICRDREEFVGRAAFEVENKTDGHGTRRHEAKMKLWGEAECRKRGWGCENSVQNFEEWKRWLLMVRLSGWLLCWRWKKNQIIEIDRFLKTQLIYTYRTKFEVHFIFLEGPNLTSDRVSESILITLVIGS